eukprot:5125283-Pyramimonas_sp.AAC.1
MTEGGVPLAKKAPKGMQKGLDAKEGDYGIVKNVKYWILRFHPACCPLHPAIRSGLRGPQDNRRQPAQDERRRRGFDF